LIYDPTSVHPVSFIEYWKIYGINRKIIMPTKPDNLQLRGTKVVLRTMVKEDIDRRLKWKPYPDPLFFHYNMPDMTPDQKEVWFSKRKNDPSALWFSIDDSKGQLVGFACLNKIEPTSKSAWLGIYFGYEFVNQGMGTDAMLTLMRYFFENMQFEHLLLDVASHNKRAIRCYEKCGFGLTRKMYSDHDPRMNIDIFGDERFREVRRYFIHDGNKVRVEFDEMEISRGTWINSKIGGRI
jgi:diamine N-acetyltransferase